MEQRVIESSVRALIDAKILVREGEQHIRYFPDSNADGDAIEELAKSYQTRPTAVINFIYASPLKSFSDAFKLKQENE